MDLRILLALGLSLLSVFSTLAAPPPGFANEELLSDLGTPMGIAFLPDGRALILEKGGEILLADTSFATSSYMTITNIDAESERGLLDLTLDSGFETNGYFYVYYTPEKPELARVSRFTHVENTGGLTSTGDLASEVVLWEDVEGYTSRYHYGGGLDIGPDDKIYFTIGDRFNQDNAQSLTSAHGKVLRINLDGSIPDGRDGHPANPFADGPEGNVDAIWALGLRNPFRARWDLPTGRLLIAEVGGNDPQTAQEDLHLSGPSAAHAGLNFGWPFCEGTCSNPNFEDCDCTLHTDPIFTYPHLGIAASLTGGVIYRGTQYACDPYRKVYFYGDFVRQWIRYLTFDPDDPSSVTGDFEFETDARLVISIEQGPDGAIYYTTAQGQLRRIVYTLDDVVVCAADCNDPCDGEVGLLDLLELLAQWNTVGEMCDFAGPPGVDVQDLLAMLAAWGPCR